MQITNSHNLPEALFNVISKIREPIEGRISVTELIDAPLIRHLRMKHWNGEQIKCDCCNGTGEIDDV